MEKGGFNMKEINESITAIKRGDIQLMRNQIKSFKSIIKRLESGEFDYIEPFDIQIKAMKIDRSLIKSEEDKLQVLKNIEEVNQEKVNKLLEIMGRL